MNLDCASFKAEEERVSEILSGKCECQPDSESSAVGGTPRSGPSVKPVEILLPEMTEPFSQTKGRRALLGDLLMMCEVIEPSMADTKGCLLGSCVLFIQRIGGQGRVGTKVTGRGTRCKNQLLPGRSTGPL